MRNLIPRCGGARGVLIGIVEGLPLVGLLAAVYAVAMVVGR